MSIPCFYLCFCLALALALALAFPQAEAATAETDRQALLEFKAKITDDPLGFLNSWNDSIHFCRWLGVGCGRRHQRVTILDLSDRNLTGSISPSIGNLSFLTQLRLDNNRLIRDIPPELGRLRRLRFLMLYNNSLAGEIPSNLSACSNLISLAVFRNSLVGSIPQELGSLSKLQRLFIFRNNLTGNIPPSLGNLSSLVRFSASSNNFIGSIPETLGKLSKLDYFSLEGSSLSGTIPPAIFNISSLRAFGVSGNRLLHGNLPSDLGNTLPLLESFGIDDNLFTGTIPVSMSNLSNLRYISLSGNQLSGKVPNFAKLHELNWLVFSLNGLGTGEADDLSFISSLTNASNLQVLGLNDNNFGGMLPESIGNLSSTLTLLRLESNHISGGIPSGMTNLINLEDLAMGNNNFTGNIPADFGKLQALNQLDLSQNKLSGNIPSSLGDLSFLIQLSLYDNNFQGRIPSTLGNCKNLISLNLAENNLNGSIPQQIFDLSSLSMSLNLSHNQLTGLLAREVGNLQNIQALDIAGNSLDGTLPSTLGSCVRLENLNLQGNFFRGSIPSSLRSLRGLQFLDLSQNNISGEIPEYFGGFAFQYLNLSFNNFEGMIPNGSIFKNTSVFSINGNPRLCGGIPELQLHSCNFEQRKKVRLTFTFKLIISLASGLLGLGLVLGFLLLYWFKKTKKGPSSDLLGNSLLKVSYQSLLRATDGFSSTNLVGMGSSASVYKGILDEAGGTLVAVKIFNLLNRSASKSFIAECKALRNIRHRNLVKVITACSGIDYRGNDFKALIYEYMDNGSLEEWLHPKAREDSAHEESKKLNLLQRLTIAVDVAGALDYLHSKNQTPIVHCDLKPSNVLLDRDLVARVGDFGLARFLPTADPNGPKDQTGSIGVRGTIGYTAPEYGMGSEVSTYGDLYSFGILLLEMFTGKSPTDDMFKDGFTLRDFVQAALPDRVVEIADPILIMQEEEAANQMRSSEKIEGCLVSIFGVGVACSAESAKERMNVADAIAELHSIKNAILNPERARLV